MTFEFHPEAQAELEKATDYYEVRQTGLGHRFVDAVLISIHLICKSPHKSRVIEGEIRSAWVPVFPYRILYSIEPQKIYILAVMHGKRKPGYWKTRHSLNP